jgi:hypothetical protein
MDQRGSTKMDNALRFKLQTCPIHTLDQVQSIFLFAGELGQRLLAVTQEFSPVYLRHIAVVVSKGRYECDSVLTL